MQLNIYDVGMNNNSIKVGDLMMFQDSRVIVKGISDFPDGQGKPCIIIVPENAHQYFGMVKGLSMNVMIISPSALTPAKTKVTLEMTEKTAAILFSILNHCKIIEVSGLADHGDAAYDLRRELENAFNKGIGGFNDEAHAKLCKVFGG